ncbi:MAG TPA: RNA-binding domain-containing protein [Candidatus Bathyarchaeia archaeon]|nr:RNA-binding domain-containing protein [Candidatus Bathyarchaeia archaeon]
MDEITVHVETEINPTEAEEKVKTAVANLFGAIAIKTEPSHVRSMLTAEARGREAMISFRNVLRRDRVRDAARRVFYAGSREKSIIFFLNKQVAFAGHVSFSQETGESPLGPIKVVIECENPRELVVWLTT